MKPLGILVFGIVEEKEFMREIRADDLRCRRELETKESSLKFFTGKTMTQYTFLTWLKLGLAFEYNKMASKITYFSFKDYSHWPFFYLQFSEVIEKISTNRNLRKLLQIET